MLYSELEDLFYHKIAYGNCPWLLPYFSMHITCPSNLHVGFVVVFSILIPEVQLTEDAYL